MGLEIAIVAAVLGVVPAAIIDKKGHKNILLWWLFGALLFILALPLAILEEDLNSDEHLVKKGERRACPHCAEPIRNAARACRYCGRDVTPVTKPSGSLGSKEPVIALKLLDLLHRTPKGLTTTEAARNLGRRREDVEATLWHLHSAGQVFYANVIGSSDVTWMVRSP